MNAVNAATVIAGEPFEAAPGGDANVDAADRRAVELDADALTLARDSATQDAGGADHIGEFLTAETEDDVAVTVRFAATDTAYNGWAWCVTLALVDRTQPTVSEVVLLPGPDALLPPRWLPWNERIRPGDLGPGDLLQPVVDDPRLVPAYVESDDPAVEDVAHELGVGRVRVMSRPGRMDTAERWHEGSFGPDSDMAKAAPAHCVMCAFYLPLAGSLAAQFGACGNEMSPADGRVVDSHYGCGAHSELVIEPVPTGFRESHIDDLVLDVHPRPEPAGPTEFLVEQPHDLEYQPVHPNAAESSSEPAETVAEATEAVIKLADLEHSSVDSESTDPVDPPELEDAPVDSDPVEPAELELAPVVEDAPAELELAPVAEDAPTELELAPFADDVPSEPAPAADGSDPAESGSAESGSAESGSAESDAAESDSAADAPDDADA